MPHLLDNLPRLKEIIIRQPFGLITDMDGSISPNPVTFQEPSIPDENQKLLTLLAPKCALVAVISGRQTIAIKNMVNVDGVKYIGHYGMERWENNQAAEHSSVRPYISPMRAVAAQIETLRAIPNLIIQDKYLTISIHYHLCENQNEVRKHILDLLSESRESQNLRVIEEKANIGILPPVAIDKGTAVSGLLQEYRLKSAIFIGDDTADVPGFRTLRRANRDAGFKGLAVLVTGQNTPAHIVNEADYSLDGFGETTKLLKWLSLNL